MNHMYNDEKLDELYTEYGEYLRNDPEEQKIQEAMKERRAKREKERSEQGL